MCVWSPYINTFALSLIENSETVQKGSNRSIRYSNFRLQILVVCPIHTVFQFSWRMSGPIISFFFNCVLSGYAKDLYLFPPSILINCCSCNIISKEPQKWMFIPFIYQQQSIPKINGLWEVNFFNLSSLVACYFNAYSHIPWMFLKLSASTLFAI